MADAPLDPAFADPAFQKAMSDPTIAAYLQAQAAAVAGGAAAAGQAAGAAVGAVNQGATAAGQTAGGAAAIDPALGTPEMQAALQEPGVREYLQAMHEQQQAQQTATGGLDPIFANPELQRQLQEPGVREYLQAMQQAGKAGPSAVDTGGEHIPIPAGVVPTGETGINTNDGAHRAAAYFTGVDMDGVTYHFYADGSKVRMDVPVVTAPGGQPTSGGAANASESSQVGLNDISIVGGRTHVKTPDGGTIVLPEGVSPDAQLWKNPATGQWYATSVDDKGMTHQYYADGQEAMTGVGASFTGPGAPPVASVTATNPAGDTGGAAAPGSAAPYAGEVHVGHAAHKSGAASSAAGEYTVKSGDTLSGIAEGIGNGTTWQELAETNHLSNPDLILPGQKIKFGAKSAGAAAGEAARQAERQEVIGVSVGGDGNGESDAQIYPQSSSHDRFKGTKTAESENIVSFKNKDSGWPPGVESSDPANMSTLAMNDPDTNPLKIDDGNHNA